jgi:uncharacterized protein (TIGR02271 family)
VWTLVAVLGAAYLLSRGLARGEVPNQQTSRRAFAAAPAQDRVHMPAPPPAGGTADRAEVTLSEEQLHVDRRERPRERVRLVKHVVTEEVTVRVPVRREEIRVERVPFGEEFPPTDGEIVSETTLSEEEPVVDTRTVARERVVMSTDVRTEEQPVSEQLRHEEVEVQREPPSGSAH